jgi:hypothetical protein
VLAGLEALLVLLLIRRGCRTCVLIPLVVRALPLGWEIILGAKLLRVRRLLSHCCLALVRRCHRISGVVCVVDCLGRWLVGFIS